MTDGPQIILDEDMVVPYLSPADLELSNPQGEYNDVRSIVPPQSGGLLSGTSFENKRFPCRIDAAGWTAELSANAKILNWGTNSELTPREVAKQFKESGTWNLPIVQSLIHDLHNVLYGQRLQNSVQQYLFENLEATCNGFLNHIILVLHDKALFESGRPVAHIFVDIIACIRFLRELARNADDESDQLPKLEDLQRRFWSEKFAAIPSHRSWFNRNWDQYAKNISHHVSEIFREINNLLLLDPEGKFKLFQSKRGNIDLPYFRAWNGDQRFRKHALLRPALPRTFRGYVFSSAGIKPGEISTQTSSMANLSDLRASVISNGAFKIMLTNDPSLHLRFDDNDEMHPTLFILDSRTVLMIAILDLTGLMLQLNLPTFLDELLASHALFFGRSTPSDKAMRTKFAGIDMKLVTDYRDHWSGGLSSVHISDFPIYGPRLGCIQQRMADWRPLHFFGLRHRPYRDSVPYYAFIFAGLFGLLSIASFILSVYGTVTGGSKPSAVG